MKAGNAEELRRLLGTLSHAEFRTAGYLLSDVLLPQCTDGEQFWHFFTAIVPTDAKAFQGTFLKAARTLYRTEVLALSSPSLDAYAAGSISAIDCRKFLETFLPEVRTVEEVQRLLQLFGSGTWQGNVAYLLSVATPACSFVLFQEFKKKEDDRAALQQGCLSLLKRGDRLAFNLAGILVRYFDLKDVPATFSLRLQPYELSRLDASYEKFKKILLSI